MAAELRSAIAPAMAWGVVVVGVAVAATVGWWEWRRPVPRRALRLLLGVGAVIALALLALRPERRSVDRTAKLLLVTAGATAGDATHQREVTGATTVITLPSRPAEQSRVLAALRAARGAEGHAMVAGWGLQPANWALLRGWTISGTPALRPFGIGLLSAPPDMEVGGRLTIRGQLTVSRPVATTIVLQGPNGIRDSTTVAPNTVTFRFDSKPRAAGSWIYRFGLGSAAGMTDSIAVDVRPHRPIGVMLLTDAPSFEINALRRWLERRGERIVVRTRVSREQFVSEQVNTDTRSATKVVAHVDVVTLALVQLVVADPAAIATLTSTERNALDLAVRDRGLGLLLLGASDAAIQALGAPAVPAMPMTEETEERLARARPADSDSASRTLVPLAAVRLTARDGDSVPVRDNASAPLVVARPEGRGVVAVTAVAASTRWLLAGEQSAFDDYWTAVLSATVGPRSDTPWQVSGAVRPGVDLPVLLTCLRSDTTRTAIIVGVNGDIDTLHAVVAQDDSTRLYARWWPRAAGWHRVTSPAGEAHLYVADDAMLSPRAAMARIDAFAERLTRSGPTAPRGAPSVQWEEISALWFLLLFVGCAGGLWAIERWGG